jgi:hypothetical protein
MAVAVASASDAINFTKQAPSDVRAPEESKCEHDIETRIIYENRAACSFRSEETAAMERKEREFTCVKP